MKLTPKESGAYQKHFKLYLKNENKINELSVSFSSCFSRLEK
jgi:hypothetical protein